MKSVPSLYCRRIVCIMECVICLVDVFIRSLLHPSYALKLDCVNVEFPALRSSGHQETIILLHIATAFTI